MGSKYRGFVDLSSLVRSRYFADFRSTSPCHYYYKVWTYKSFEMTNLFSPAAKQSKLVGLRKVVVEPSNLVCSLLISIEFNSVEEPIRKMMRQCVKRPLKIAI